MMVAGHDARKARLLAVVFDDRVTGGHIGGGKAAAHGRAEGHMAHHGHTVDQGQRFAGKAAGAHAGGDDGDDVHNFSLGRDGPARG